MDVQIKKACVYLGNIVQIICLNVTIDDELLYIN